MRFNDADVNQTLFTPSTPHTDQIDHLDRDACYGRGARAIFLASSLEDSSITPRRTLNSTSNTMAA